jgi:hypothetical protein
MKRISGNLTYANVMVTVLTILVVGGGSAYAATRLGKESVGTAQLKKEAVTPAKLSKAAKATLTGASGQTGPVGPSGAQGSKGDTGPEGPEGRQGRTGEPGPLLDELPSGRTEKGVFGLEGTAATVESRAATSLSFPIPLPPEGALAHTVSPGDPASAACPGTVAEPQAEAGWFCLYVARTSNVAPLYPLICDPVADLCNAVGRLGGYLDADLMAAGAYDAEGTWAVTAP